MNTDAGQRQRSAAAAALEERFHLRIPISAAMGIRVTGWDGTRLELSAALAPNVNVHGTGFAGSLYSIAVLCGWGLVHLHLAQAGATADIVVAKAGISYQQPVTGPIIARCQAEPQMVAAALAKLADTGRARFPLQVTIGDPAQPVVVLDGGYAVVAPSGHKG